MRPHVSHVLERVAAGVDRDALPDVLRRACRPATVDRQQTRNAVVDELLAACVEPLTVLARRAALAERQGRSAMSAAGLAAAASTVLSLVDAALETHGRDVGYSARAWLDHTLDGTLGYAQELPALTTSSAGLELSTIVNEAAGQIAVAIRATPRDRMAVPEALAAAAVRLLTLVLIAEAW